MQLVQIQEPSGGRPRRFFCVKEDRFVMRMWIAFVILAFAGIFLSGCTDYERAGVNPRPFNEPRSWEINPYGPNMFQN